MQFTIAAAVVLCASMLLLGTFVTQQITRSVLASTVAGTEAFFKTIVEPLLEETTDFSELPPSVHEKLDDILAARPLFKNIVTLKIWRTDGTILYVNEPKSLIGRTFASQDVTRAATGGIVAKFEDMESEESRHEQGVGRPLLEIYAPLRDRSGKIVAVGEIYESASVLDVQLDDSRKSTWLFVCFTTLVMLGFLFLIVRRGNRVIEQQRSALQAKFVEFSALARVNQELRIEADRSRLDANAANEELIGRVGLDLHDGPIQLLSLLMLKLGQLRRRSTTDEDVAYATAIQELTGEVIRELRSLSAGLVLPEIREMGVEDTIRLAVQRHENLTGTKVVVESDNLPEDIQISVKICIYRIVQECLNNAFKHAGGVGQHVAATRQGSMIALSVSDQGAGPRAAADQGGDGTKLGLQGIRNRAATFGGTVEVSADGHGTTVTVHLPISPSEGEGATALRHNLP